MWDPRSLTTLWASAACYLSNKHFRCQWVNQARVRTYWMYICPLQHALEYLCNVSFWKLVSDVSSVLELHTLNLPHALDKIGRTWAQNTAAVIAVNSFNLGITWRRVVSFTLPHRETAPVTDWIGGWVSGAQPHFPGRTFRSRLYTD
jgi:hypothetical protein